MRFEFDQTAKTITCEDYTDEPIIFKCNSYYQYNGLCKNLLSPSQQEKHIAYSIDGIYSVSNKRLKLGQEYMKTNDFNPK